MYKKIIGVVLGLIFTFGIAKVSFAGPTLQEWRLEMQKKFQSEKYDCEYPLNLDKATVNVLKKFLTDHGLKADGICGPETMNSRAKVVESKAQY